MIDGGLTQAANLEVGGNASPAAFGPANASSSIVTTFPVAPILSGLVLYSQWAVVPALGDFGQLHFSRALRVEFP